jgi:hypothetical protein
MTKKINAHLLTRFLNEINHYEIYRLHMAQAQRALKQFKDDAEMTAKIQAVIQNIRETYRLACAKDQEVA